MSLCEWIPAGLELHHVCENKLCVNPEHLQPMTRCDHLRLHRNAGGNV
jgi:hypothetical protein